MRQILYNEKNLLMEKRIFETGSFFLAFKGVFTGLKKDSSAQKQNVAMCSAENRVVR